MQGKTRWASLTILFATVMASSCKSKSSDSTTKTGSGSAVVQPVAPATCPPGSAIDQGVCVAAVTAEKVEAVAQQISKVDEFAKLLDKADLVAGPVELLGGFRQLDAWKTLIKLNSKLQIVDEVAAALDTGVKELRSLKTTAQDASAKLGDLRGQLNGLLTTPSVALPLAKLQSDVTAKLHAVLDPLESQITKVAQSALGPAAQKINDVSDLVLGACAMAKVSGGGDAMKALCEQAKDGFTKASGFLSDFKNQPMALFSDVTGNLQSKLSNLVDEQTSKLLQEAQTRVNALLSLPPPSGSGSAVGSSQ
jgi:hypothetical protein